MNRIIIRVFVICAVYMALGWASVAECGTIQRLYWTDNSKNTVNSASIDGSSAKVLISTGLSYPSGIDVDMVNKKIYYADVDLHKIFRANLDGSGVETVVANVDVSLGLSVDPYGEKLHWTGAYSSYQSMMDGTGVVATGPAGATCVDLDPNNGKLYFTRITGHGQILRINPDGSGFESLLTGLGYPFGIALDTLHGKMYWANHGSGMIQRANLDGTDVENLVTGLGWLIGIAVDSEGDQIYWTENSSIRTSHLDGSNVHDVITGLNSPVGLAVGPVPEPTTLAVLALGGMALIRRRRKKLLCPVRKRL